jgi:hypothetical protein
MPRRPRCNGHPDDPRQAECLGRGACQRHACRPLLVASTMPAERSRQVPEESIPSAATAGLAGVGRTVAAIEAMPALSLRVRRIWRWGLWLPLWVQPPAVPSGIPACRTGAGCQGFPYNFCRSPPRLSVPVREMYFAGSSRWQLPLPPCPFEKNCCRASWEAHLTSARHPTR